MRFSWAKTPTMDEISRVNRGLMCSAVTTGCVCMGGGGSVVGARHIGAIVRQGQPTWETRADVPRRGWRGYFARQAVGGVWAGPWRGGCGPMRCPAATSAALPCRRGAGDAGFHVGTVPPGRYTARRRAKYPRRPRRGTSKQGPAQGPAATSAALPCGRGCRGRGISRRNSSEVKSRITKPTAGAWPDYVAHKKIKRESACMGGGLW